MLKKNDKGTYSGYMEELKFSDIVRDFLDEKIFLDPYHAILILNSHIGFRAYQTVTTLPMFSSIIEPYLKDIAKENDVRYFREYTRPRSESWRYAIDKGEYIINFGFITTQPFNECFYTPNKVRLYLYKLDYEVIKEYEKRRLK